jgi:hypothetical protein
MALISIERALELLFWFEAVLEGKCREHETGIKPTGTNSQNIPSQAQTQRNHPLFY